MILTSLLFAALIGLCISTAALAADRAASALLMPRRFIWLTALLTSIVWPLVAIFMKSPNEAGSGVPLGVGPVAAAMESVAAFSSQSVSGAGAISLDMVVIALWALASTLLLVRMLIEMIRVRSARKGWRKLHLDGTTVSIADNEGPAIVSARGGEIVIPSYALMFEPSLRALILRHEGEHLRARDPALIFISRLLIVLFPWNPALLWQARRLRLALEIDCDARVLRSHPDSDRYAKLLLAIAQMRSATPLRTAIALAEGSSQLEERIKAMKNSTGRRRWSVAAAALIFSVAEVAVAAEVQRPSQAVAAQDMTRAVEIVRNRIEAIGVAEPKADSGQVAGAPTAQQQQQQQQQQQRGARSTQNTWGAFLASQVDQQVKVASGNMPPRYPAELRAAGVTGRVVASFVVDENGSAIMESLTIVEASHTALADEVRKALPNYKFIPAEFVGQRVRAWITMPFEFSLSGASRDAATAATATGATGATGATTVATASAAAAATAAATTTTSATKAASTTSGTSAIAATGATQSAQTMQTSDRASAAISSGQPFFQFEVEQKVQMLPGSPKPIYPAALRQSRIEGRVLVSVVIDGDGRADMGTIKVMESSHDLLTDAVRNVLPNIRFRPAAINGHVVKSWVQLPFEFSLGGRN